MAPVAQVRTTLTTEQSQGQRRGGQGSRLVGGSGRLVGVALVPKVRHVGISCVETGASMSHAPTCLPAATPATSDGRMIPGRASQLKGLIVTRMPTGPQVDDAFLDNFLLLPNDALAVMSCEIELLP